MVMARRIRDIELHDSWKQDHDQTQTFKDLYSALSRRGFSLTFVRRDPEQGREGTCTLISLARAMALSAGVPVELPIPDEIIVFSHRLVKICEKVVV